MERNLWNLSRDSDGFWRFLGDFWSLGFWGQHWFYRFGRIVICAGSVDQIPGQERMKIPEQKMDYYKDLKIPGWCSGKSPPLDSCSSMVWQFNHIQTTIFGRDSPAMFRWAAARRGPRCTWARTGQVIGNGEKWFQPPGEPRVLSQFLQLVSTRAS